MTNTSPETFKTIISLLEENNLYYGVFGGFAFDGIRKQITREHSDIDIYLKYDDLDNLKKLFIGDHYTFYEKDKMHYIESEGLKIGMVLITEDDDYIIAHGSNTVVQFPKEIWKDKNIMMIDDISFNCVPNEALVFDSQFSKYTEDKELGLRLEYDRDLYSRIRVITSKTPTQSHKII